MPQTHTVTLCNSCRTQTILLTTSGRFLPMRGPHLSPGSPWQRFSKSLFKPTKSNRGVKQQFANTDFQSLNVLHPAKTCVISQSLWVSGHFTSPKTDTFNNKSIYWNSSNNSPHSLRQSSLNQAEEAGKMQPTDKNRDFPH